MGFTFIYTFMNKPVTVSLKSSGKKSNYNASYNINLTPTLINDSLTSFDYPKGLSLQSRVSAGKLSVDDYIFGVKDTYNWTLVVDISTLPEGQLSELSSYTLRQDNPSEFSQVNETINGRPVIIFNDNDFNNGFSKVAYIVDGNNVATISLVGDDSSGINPLIKTFNMVIDSWQWR
jgi:hypothetical protein